MYFTVAETFADFLIKNLVKGNISNLASYIQGVIGASSLGCHFNTGINALNQNRKIYLKNFLILVSTFFERSKGSNAVAF